jgi:DNA sulfur modification protein DndD
LIHGYNGSGKTALLNAFVWCLYGRTTADLESPHLLANEHSLAVAPEGVEVPVQVRLRFRVRGEVYIAERTAGVRRAPAGAVQQTEPKLVLRRIGTSGESELQEAPQLRIDQLLPPDLYPFFFFNGERVERLASPNAYDEVEQGVKTLLDVEIYDRSMHHLRDWIYSELGKELRSYGNDEAKRAVDEEEQKRAEQAQQHERLGQHQRNEAELASEIALIEQKQREMASVGELVLQRDAALARQGDVESRIREHRADAARRLSRDGYLAFGEQVFARTAALVSQARQRGELPAKVKPQFVDDLLSAGECICGRPLADASPERGRLIHWRGATGLADLEEAISQTNSSVTSLRERRRLYFEDIARIQAATSEAYAEKRRLDDQAAELDAKIGDPGNGYDAAELEQKRQALLRRREDERVSRLRTKEKLDELDEALRALQQRIERLKIENEKAALVQHQMHVVTRIANAMEAIYMIQKQDVREELARSVEMIWKDAAVKDYKASVTPEFRLELTKSVGGIVQPVHGASTGEKQVLALSFVGSLVRKAKQNEDRNVGENTLGGKELKVGGEYPLVMDSPFGALEDDYRRKVAEWVPTLAGQVVVMVSKTQWRDEVEDAVRPRVGREYVLELHTPKPDAERSIEIRGQTYPYVRTSSENVEQTIIQEVN